MNSNKIFLTAFLLLALPLQASERIERITQLIENSNKSSPIAALIESLLKKNDSQRFTQDQFDKIGHDVLEDERMKETLKKAKIDPKSINFIYDPSYREATVQVDNPSFFKRANTIRMGGSFPANFPNATEFKAALPVILRHEMSHIVNNDHAIFNNMNIVSKFVELYSLGLALLLLRPESEKLAYSRDFESRADDFAIEHTREKSELLATARIFDKSFAGSDSCHPAGPERAEKFRRAAKKLDLTEKFVKGAAEKL